MQTQLNVVATEDEVDQDLLNNNNDVIDDDYEIENSADEKSDDKSWETTNSALKYKESCLALNILLENQCCDMYSLLFDFYLLCFNFSLFCCVKNTKPILAIACLVFFASAT